MEDQYQQMLMQALMEQTSGTGGALGNMRQASNTGGALGNMSNRDASNMGGALGNMRQASGMGGALGSVSDREMDEMAMNAPKEGMDEIMQMMLMMMSQGQ